MSEYLKQAEELAAKFGVKMEILDHEIKSGYFEPKDPARSIFKIRLKRGRKSFSFDYGQALARTGEEPTLYDIFAFLPQYDPEDFKNFCGMYGYSEDSRQAEKVFKAESKLYSKVASFFTEEELEELREID